MNCANALLLSAAMVCCAQVAAEPPARHAIVAGVKLPLGSDGRVAAIDEERRQQILANLTAEFAVRGINATSGPTRVAHDGAEALTLGLDNQHIAVARYNADGALEMACVKGADAAAAFLAAAAE